MKTKAKKVMTAADREKLVRSMARQLADHVEKHKKARRRWNMHYFSDGGIP
jgi:hypothetical protein